MSPTDPPVARAVILGDRRLAPRATPGPGSMTSSASWPRASGTTWTCPTRTSYGRRGRPPGAVHRHAHRELARRAAAGDHRAAEGGQRVIGEELEALGELAVRERAERPEDRGGIDGELRDADRTHAVEQHPSHLCRPRCAGDRSPGTDEQVDRTDRVVVEHGGQPDACGGLHARELLDALGQRLRAGAHRLHEIGHRGLIARLRRQPCDASRRAGHVRDAGQAAGGMQARRDRAVRLRQRPDRATGSQVDREDAEGACRGDRRDGPRQRRRGEMRLVLLGDGVAEQALEMIPEVSAVLAMRRRPRVADGGHRAGLEQRPDRIRQPRGAGPHDRAAIDPSRRRDQPGRLQRSGAAGIVEAPRQQPRVDLDRLEQGEALGEGSSVVEGDDVGDLPTGGLGGAAGGTAGDLARNRHDGQAADLARGVAFDPVRGAQQVLVAAGKARIARCLQLLDQLPSQLGGSPRGGLRRVRNDAPSASRPPHDARLDPRRADVDEERHLGADRCRHDSRPSQSPSRKTRRSIRSTRRDRSR